MLKNMKVKTSLLMGFGISILLSTVMIVIALFLMNTQSAAYQHILDSYVAANKLITNCRLDANIAARSVRDMALTVDKTSNAQLQARIDEMLADLDASIRELRSIYPLENTDKLNEYIAANCCCYYRWPCYRSSPYDQGRMYPAAERYGQRCTGN